MNTVTKQERAIIDAEAKRLAKSGLDHEQIAEKIAAKFRISPERAQRAAAIGIIYWRHPARK